MVKGCTEDDDIPMNLRFFCKGHSGQYGRLCEDHPGKGRAYLGIVNALQAIQELLRGIDDSEIDAKGLGEVLLDLLALIESHNAI